MIIIDIIAVFIILFGAVLWAYCTSKSRYDYISFRESLDLTGLPIITFHQGKTKLNFIFDTGSNLSVIDKEVIKKLKLKETNKKCNITGIGGTSEVLNIVEINFKYKDNELNDYFQVLNMEDTLSIIKKSTGVTIHGLIGNNFMQKYNYVLDFDEMVAYSKKK